MNTSKPFTIPYLNDEIDKLEIGEKIQIDKSVWSSMPTFHDLKIWYETNTEKRFTIEIVKFKPRIFKIERVS